MTDEIPTNYDSEQLEETANKVRKRLLEDASGDMTHEVRHDHDCNEDIENNKENDIAPGDALAAMTTDDVSALLTSSRDTHGDAVENQQHIATAWQWYLDGQGKLDSNASITGSDVAMMMGLLKMSRNAVGEFDVDHFRDIAGYAAIGAACAVDNDDFDAERDDLADYHDPTKVTRDENTDAHH